VIIQNVTLLNFCQHKALTTEFSPHLNMIVGRNGSGKTNLLRAMEAAITGDFGGGKGNDIRQTANEKDPSEVVLTLEHHGDSMCVTRRLRPNSNELHLRGKLTGRTFGEVNEAILEFLGVSKKQVGDYVFVGQKEVAELLEKTPAERGRELASLFGVTHAEKIWSSIGEYLSGVTMPATGVDLDEAKAALQTAKNDRDNLLVKMTEYSHVPDDITEYMAAKQQVIDDYQKRLQLDQALHQIDVSIDGANDVITGLETTFNQAITDRKEISDALELMREDFLAATDELRLLEVNRAFRDLISIAEDKLTAALDALQLQPMKPAEFLETDVLEGHRSQLRHTDARREYLAALQDNLKHGVESGKCPTCEQPAVDLQRRLDNTSQELVAVERAANDIRTHITSTDGYHNTMKEWQRQKGRVDEATTELESVKKNDPGPAPSDDQIAAWKKVTADHRELSDAKYGLDTQVASVQATLEETRKRLESDKLQQAQHVTALQQLPTHTLDSQLAAQSDMAKMQQDSKSLAILQGERTRADQIITMCQKTVKDTQDILAKGRRVRTAVAHLDDVRRIFHRDQAPRMVSFTYLEQMQHEINETLGLFDAPFRVTADETLGFTAEFLDGSRIVPDRRLSVGERVVLAMAFRIAVNSTFAGSLGLLSLDEPTAGLDEHNMGCLPQALERLREISQARGLQVFFVTHEPRISNLFDNVLDLDQLP
jgi:DNA repair exonuclease SbcCD ATPase subunit